MAYGSWEEIVHECRIVYTERSRISENARGILDLIPLIKQRPVFKDLIPGTSHTTLFFIIPNKQTQVYVWYEDGVYGIYHHVPNLDEESKLEIFDKRNKADLASVVATLETQIEKIRNSEEYT